jgi:hypothetical protein
VALVKREVMEWLSTGRNGEWCFYGDGDEKTAPQGELSTYLLYLYIAAIAFR